MKNASVLVVAGSDHLNSIGAKTLCSISSPSLQPKICLDQRHKIFIQRNFEYFGLGKFLVAARSKILEFLVLALIESR